MATTKFSNNNIISLSLLVLGLGIALISITTSKTIGSQASNGNGGQRLSCQSPNGCYQIGSTTTTASKSAVVVGTSCTSIGLATAPNKSCGAGYICCGIVNK